MQYEGEELAYLWNDYVNALLEAATLWSDFMQAFKGTPQRIMDGLSQEAQRKMMRSNPKSKFDIALIRQVEWWRVVGGLGELLIKDIWEEGAEKQEKDEEKGQDDGE